MSGDRRIEGVDLTIYLEDGGMLNIEVSPAMLAAFVQSTGLRVRDVVASDGQTYCGVYRFDDKTIEQNILPLLPRQA